MTSTFEERAVENAEAARLAIETFLSTKGSLTEIQEIPRYLVESMQETLGKLKVFLELKQTEAEIAEVEEEPEPRQDPPARSLEGKILRDIRNGKEVTSEGDPERKKAFNFLSRNGFIQNTGSRRYPQWEAIDD